MNQELNNYIQQARASGMNDQQISDTLRAQGWLIDDINEALGGSSNKDNYSQASVVQGSGFILKHKKFVIFIAIIAAIIILTIIFPQTYLYPYYKYDISVNVDGNLREDLNTMPSMRTITPGGALSSRSFDFDGLSFKSPWVGEPTIKENTSLRGFIFANNAQVVVFKSGFDDYSYSEIRDSFSTGLSDLKFDSGIGVWAERMAIKGISAVNARFGFYEFQYGGIKGFQVGDPSKNNAKEGVAIMLFNANNELREILVQNAKSQGEIDSIISSIDY